ncbi:MAG: acyl-CoA thioester hydrolase/BAAT C-terminal domain-containing protein, partial [Pseudobdellovibrionaceae bacterium]
ECHSQNFIILLGGSEGGIPAYAARPFAARGLSVLALGYFSKIPGTPLPPMIDRIPLEYFENSFQQVSHLFPDSKCCVLVGFSKGAEAALAVATTANPNFLGMILLSGTDRAFEGFTRPGGDPSKNSSWIYNGLQIPFSPYVVADGNLEKQMYPEGRSKAPVFKPLYDATIRLPTGDRGLYQIQNVKSSILMFSGEDDQLWPSSLFFENIVRSAKESGFANEIRHYSYPKTGHFVLFGEKMLMMDPYNAIQFGGTVEGSRAAEVDVWKKTAEYLRKVYGL